jgi:type IV secretion system protein VirB1
MPLDPSSFLTLAPVCAPAVSPTTLLAIAKVESGLDPWAIGVNGSPVIKVRPTSAAEATQRAAALIAAGRDIDLGLTQINVRNLGRLGLTIADAFDPCRNLAASAVVLQTGYAAARATGAAAQPALRQALSRYNTGDQARGFRNGYVTRVLAAAANLEAPVTHRPPRPSAARPPDWDAFRDLGKASFVISTSSAQGATP